MWVFLISPASSSVFPFTHSVTSELEAIADPTHEELSSTSNEVCDMTLKRLMPKRPLTGCREDWKNGWFRNRLRNLQLPSPLYWQATTAGLFLQQVRKTVGPVLTRYFRRYNFNGIDGRYQDHFPSPHSDSLTHVKAWRVSWANSATLHAAPWVILKDVPSGFSWAL